jgi:hypothetical protein
MGKCAGQHIRYLGGAIGEVGEEGLGGTGVVFFGEAKVHQYRHRRV